MRKLTFLTAAGALALGGAGAVMANHHADHSGAAHGPEFERADADADGVITLDEAKMHAGERFAIMDANDDGAISKDDREARAELRFGQTDTNQDGEISPEEMTAAREKREAERAARRAERQTMMFERLDTDGSGGLSEDEIAAGRSLRVEAGAEHRGRLRGRPGMRMLRRADTNNDEAVSREEFDAMVEARFARIDTDDSGTITQAERDAAKAKLRAGRGRAAEPGTVRPSAAS